MMNLMFEGTDFEGTDFEVCEAFRVAIEHDEPVCASCGHLADDHGRAAGTVARLRRRGRGPARRPAPARKAS